MALVNALYGCYLGSKNLRLVFKDKKFKQDPEKPVVSLSTEEIGEELLHRMSLNRSERVYIDFSFE